MARSQEDLRTILEDLEGVIAAYIQKPLNTQLVPPYIVQEFDDDWVDRADNIVYRSMNRYTVTVVVREPDSPIPGLIRDLPYARFDRRFVSAGLYHFVYNLYF
jgi:hypothetical protein